MTTERFEGRSIADNMRRVAEIGTTAIEPRLSRLDDGSSFPPTPHAPLYEKLKAVHADDISLADYAEGIHRWACDWGFWDSNEKCPDFSDATINIGRNDMEALMLSVTEIAEAAECLRHCKNGSTDEVVDPHTPFPNYAVEIADAIIRLLDLGYGRFGDDFAKAFKAKFVYNLSRPHRHGKTC